MNDKEAIQYLKIAHTHISRKLGKVTLCVALELAIKALEDKRSEGEWLWVGFDGDRFKWSCSLCGRGVEDQEKFCPNCGAKMVLDEVIEEKEDE